MFQEVCIVDNKEELENKIKKIFEDEKEYKFKRIEIGKLADMLNTIPTLIIINEDTICRNILDVCNEIRADDDNSITPIIVVSSNKEKEHRIEILNTAVEYYILSPIDVDYLYYTVKNILRLINTNRTVSPLTGLPGNVQIHTEMKKNLLQNENFTVMYFDLDNFKAYNDVYGFLKGDEIIKFTARIILKHVHCNECESCFVGHIGGDDFVAIIKGSDAEKICQNIIAEFDSEIKKYFYEEDLQKGYLEVANRKNIIEQFPITSISIGVVEIEKGRFHNILEIGEVGAQVKHLAKTIMGSSYVIDRRR